MDPYVLSLERAGWAWPGGQSKNQWGQLGWHWLHTNAAQFPARPTPHDVFVMHTRLWRFITNLPCIDCRGHATKYVHDHPPPLTSGAAAFQQWAWAFHNTVNARLGKRTITFPESQRFYAAMRTGRGY